MSSFSEAVVKPSLDRQLSQDSFVSDYSYDGESSDGEEDEEKIKSPQKDEYGNDGACIVSLDDVLRSFMKEAKQCSEMCGIGEAMAMFMLRGANYNKDAVVSEYFDQISKDSGSTGKATKYLPAKVTYGSVSGNKDELNTCFVCCNDEVKNADFISLGCSHFYCRDCWSNYLGSKITEGQVFGMRCMSPDCNISLGYSDVEKISQGAGFDKYCKFVAQKVVAENKRYAFCPAKGCEAISELNLQSTGKSVNCRNCHYSFCLSCQEEAHEPATCTVHRKWLKLNADDGMNVAWLSTFTKECPKCLRPIEKSGGCNHMTCGQCRHEFCWLCRQNWRNHTDCHTHKAPVGVSEQRKQLERYQHFHTRYSEHGRSVANQKTMMLRLLKKGTELEKKSVIVGVQPSEYLGKGLKAAMFARKVLRFTYVHAYFMEKEDEQRLFEYQQGELERAVENLSYKLEHCPEEGQNISNAGAVAVKQAQHVLDAGTSGVFDIIEDD